MKSTFEEELERYGSFTYKNKGSSMMPLLRENRDLYTIVKKRGRCHRYDTVLFKRDNGDYVLHRILKVNSKSYTLCGDHQIHPEYNIREEQVLGVMTLVQRDGRMIKVTDWKYQIYVHLWCDFFYIRAGILWLKALPRRVKHKLRS